jgi:hypothetical protein
MRADERADVWDDLEQLAMSANDSERRCAVLDACSHLEELLKEIGIIADKEMGIMEGIREAERELGLDCDLVAAALAANADRNATAHRRKHYTQREARRAVNQLRGLFDQVWEETKEPSPEEIAQRQREATLDELSKVLEHLRWIAQWRFAYPPLVSNERDLHLAIALCECVFHDPSSSPDPVLHFCQKTRSFFFAGLIQFAAEVDQRRAELDRANGQLLSKLLAIDGASPEHLRRYDERPSNCDVTGFKVGIVVSVLCTLVGAMMGIDFAVSGFISVLPACALGVVVWAICRARVWAGRRELLDEYKRASRHYKSEETKGLQQLIPLRRKLDALLEQAPVRPWGGLDKLVVPWKW